jgi:hypothetical protein
MAAADSAGDRERLLDRHFPDWHFREVHRRRIAASPERALALALALRPRDVPLSATLLTLRLAPAAVAAGRSPLLPRRPLIELFGELGFVELARGEREIVLGAAGQFWRFREELEPIADADAFGRFREPGFAKAAINFHAAPVDGATLLTTETRVWAVDDRARRAFRPYWLPVRAAGELIRRELLAAVARRARAPS